MRLYKFRQLIVFIALIVISLSVVKFCEAQEGNNAAVNASPIYAGMSKEEIYKVYPRTSEIDYYNKGNEEWLIFDDIKTEAPDDKIILYLKDNKLVWWNNEVLPETPAERLKIVEEREKYCRSMPPAPVRTQDSDMYMKEATRRERIESRRGIWAAY